jgi:predicted metal-binding transcription factor (methanogenesis marker protein 9)
MKNYSIINKCPIIENNEQIKYYKEELIKQKIEFLKKIEKKNTIISQIFVVKECCRRCRVPELMKYLNPW